MRPPCTSSALAPHPPWPGSCYPDGSVMLDAIFPLPFTAQDLQLLSINRVSAHLRTSRAFVQLCLTAGCPTRRGRLSAAELLHWLFEHYCEVRDLAGFSPLPLLDSIPEPAQTRLKMANAVI